MAGRRSTRLLHSSDCRCSFRAGSIIPMGPDVQYAAEKPADPIELRVYPGADGDFTLYEDENDTYNYEKGAYAIIPFHWDDAKRTLTIGERKGHSRGWCRAASSVLYWFEVVTEPALVRARRQTRKLNIQEELWLLRSKRRGKN